jgi:hypothetical protein
MGLTAGDLKNLVYPVFEIDAYKNWQTFVASLENILREFGKKYVINFV